MKPNALEAYCPDLGTEELHSPDEGLGDILSPERLPRHQAFFGLALEFLIPSSQVEAHSRPDTSIAIYFDIVTAWGLGTRYEC
jgi:hypothetical protein